MSMPPLRPIHSLFLLTLAASAIDSAAAQSLALPAASQSRIARVKLYPGSATVDRVGRLVAGSRSFSFSCLPAGLDAQSLQVSADATVSLGEIAVAIQPRASSPACSGSALDQQILALEDQKATLQAENEALDLVTGYLKGLSGTAGNARPPVDGGGLAGVTDTMRRTGQEALLKQYQLKRRQAELDRQLNPLLTERARLQGSDGGNVTNVTVTLAASRDAEIKLSYRVNGPGWTPSYRALLDTATGRLRLERQALVAQATGEDWRGVKLVLSTGQPRQGSSGRLPTPWRIGVMSPYEDAGLMGAVSYNTARKAAPAPMTKGDERAEERPPLFDVSVFNNAFATEFDIPNPIDVPSDGQRVNIALGQHQSDATLAVRTSPQVDTRAFLVAELTRPDGVWPAGPLQLYRDGAFVGNDQWQAGDEKRMTLSFGEDELVRVRVEPALDSQGSSGFAGGRAERRVQRSFAIENRHQTPIDVQVLEAAPVSVDEQVKVSAQFSPQPAELAWNKQPGVAMWRFALDAGKTSRIAADYKISYPKDVQLQE